MMARDMDGRFSAVSATAISLSAAAASYYRALEGVCRYQGLTPRGVARSLVSKGRNGKNFDLTWRKACYARQLAIYLANTAHDIPQRLLADVVGLTPAAVCLAVQSIEDLRDHGDYETLCVLASVVMGET